MITNRHKSRVLNEIISTWVYYENFILYGVQDDLLTNSVLTREQEILIEGLAHYGLEVERCFLGNRKIELSLIITL